MLQMLLGDIDMPQQYRATFVLRQFERHSIMFPINQEYWSFIRGETLKRGDFGLLLHHYLQPGI